MNTAFGCSEIVVKDGFLSNTESRHSQLITSSPSHSIGQLQTANTEVTFHQI